MLYTLVRYYGPLLLTYMSRCAVHPAVAVPYSIHFLLFTGALLRQTLTLAVRAVALNAQPALYIILDTLAGALQRQTLTVAVRAAALPAQPALYYMLYRLYPSQARCFGQSLTLLMRAAARQAVYVCYTLYAHPTQVRCYG